MWMRPASLGWAASLYPPGAEVHRRLAAGTLVEIWFQDRWGGPGKQTHLSLGQKRHPQAAHDQCTASTFVFGAACPGGVGSALVLPDCNSKAMQIHLDVIAGKVGPKPARPPTLGRHLL